MTCYQNPIIRKGESKACAYAWTRNAGTKSSQTAIISAHGDSTWINGTFPKGTYTLGYFCPHGTNLVDVGLTRFMDGTAMVVQTVNSQNIEQDYNLMKYQNKHNNVGESYDVVKRVVDEKHLDVITIKNQKDFFGDPEDIKLSELITLLRFLGYDYDAFLCCFCRGGVHFEVASFFTREKTSFEPFMARDTG